MRILIPLFLGFLLKQASAEDLSLSQAVKLAISTHPSADSARSALRAAAERIPEAKAGSEFIQFSPADQLEVTEAAIRAGLRLPADVSSGSDPS